MKKISLLFAFCFLFSMTGAAIATDATDTVADEAIEEVMETDYIEFEETLDESTEMVAVEEEAEPVAAAATTPSVVKRKVEEKTPEKKETDKADATSRRLAAKGSPVSRASESMEAASAARIGMLMKATAPAAPTSVPGKIRAASAPSLASTTATAIEKTDEKLECLEGEYPKGKKCEKCFHKNNPAAEWMNPGKNCKLMGCYNAGEAEYILVDANKDEPACVKKCEIWGGYATREWDGERFGICGSGKAIECDSGFKKTNEKTSTSEIEFWHCVPRGTMMGSCKNKGSIQVCEFPNGRGQQTCENGFWSNCAINRMCKPDFVETNHREVYSVSKKQDQKTGIFDCTPKETLKLNFF